MFVSKTFYHLSVLMICAFLAHLCVGSSSSSDGSSSSSSSGSSSSSSSSSSSGGSSNRLVVPGDFCHGANIQYDYCISDFSNPNLDLTDDARFVWASDCRSEIELFSGPVVEGLDESNEFMAAVLTQDEFNLLLRFGINLTQFMTPNELGNPRLPILDSASIVYYSDPIVGNLRSRLPGYNDVLNGDYPKYSTFRNYDISSQGNYSLEEWNKANGDVTLTCDSDRKTGTIKIRARSLVPHMPYTIWGAWGISGWDFTTGGNPREMNQVAGAPSAFFADGNGNADLFYNVPYCPLDTHNPLMYISLLMHWNLAIPGAFVALGIPANSDHLCFTVGDYL